MDEREKRRRLAGSRQREEKINLYRVVAKRLSLNLAIRDANNSNVPRINRSLEALLRPRNEFKTMLLTLSSFLPLFSILFCILSSFKYSINLDSITCYHHVKYHYLDSLPSTLQVISGVSALFSKTRMEARFDNRDERTNRCVIWRKVNR